MFGRKINLEREAKSVEKCTSCGREDKRDFEDGDAIFSKGHECVKCKKPTRIVSIYGQIKEP